MALLHLWAPTKSRQILDNEVEPTEISLRPEQRVGDLSYASEEIIEPTTELAMVSTSRGDKNSLLCLSPQPTTSSPQVDTDNPKCDENQGTSRSDDYDLLEESSSERVLTPSSDIVYAEHLVRAELAENVEDDVGNTQPGYHYLMPIYTEALMMLSGDRTLKDTMFNREALKRLIDMVHVLDREDVATASSPDYLGTLQTWLQTPTHCRASVKRKYHAAETPLGIIKSKMETRKRIREGIAESRFLAMSFISQHKEISDISDGISHRMKRAVAEMRYQYLDTLIEKMTNPLCPSAKDRSAMGRQLQRWQLQEAEGFCDRTQAVRNEFEEIEKNCNEAIRDLFLTLAEEDEESSERLDTY